MPERTDYRFPAQEGVIKLAVEHMDYSKAPYTYLFIYGKMKKGRKSRSAVHPEAEPFWRMDVGFSLLVGGFAVVFGSSPGW